MRLSSLPNFFLGTILSLALAVLTGCQSGRSCCVASSSAASPPRSSENFTNVLAEQSLLTVLWFQRAAECRALYHQACNIARDRLDDHLAHKLDSRPSAVIVDIDETILDNSPYQAGLFRSGRIYEEVTWSNWVRVAQAEVLPGVASFLQYARSREVEVFYVSNRKFPQQAETIRNLKEKGLPWADEKHVLLRTGPSSKDDRRGPLLTNGVYDVVLLLGDNLADFHHGFESTNQVARQEFTEAQREAFGRKYIVLPNPMYGDWEGALYDIRNTPPGDKLRRRDGWLRAFNFERGRLED